MPYFVYVSDAKTGEALKRLFSDATSEDAARAEAESRGLQVTSIVVCRDDQRPDAALPTGQNAGVIAAGNGAIAVDGTQRDAIDGVARYMKIVGIVQIVIAVVLIALGVFAKSLPTGIQGAVMLLLGVLTTSTAGKFRRINEERGNPGLLTDALESLRSLYFVQLVIFGICVVLIVVLLLVFFVVIKR